MLVMAVAVLTAAVGVFGAVLGARVVSGMEDAFDRQLDLAEASLAATNDAVVASGEALEEVSSALDGAATTALIVGGALEATTDLLDEVAVLLGEDVPESIRSFRATIPGLIATASAVDATLRAVDIFTVGDYDPEVPLDDAIAGLDESIADLPDDLAAQAVLLRQATGTIVGVSASMEQTAQDVVEVRAALTRAGRVLERQASATADALGAVDELRTEAANRFGLATLLAVVMGIALAVSQVGSFAFGWYLFEGAIGQAGQHEERNDADGDTDEVGGE